MSIREGQLVLRDGSVFEGELIGAVRADGVSSGEVVFHTGLTGYQEVISDPSYAGQIITFTTPHIGNYGTTPLDNEAVRVHARGVIVREEARRESNWRSEHSLNSYLSNMGVSGIAGIDTRRLTRILRDTGAMPGAFGSADHASLLSAAQSEAGTTGVQLVEQVTTKAAYVVGSGHYKVVAYDFGIKSTILRCLSDIATVTVVPASTSADEVRALAPHGVFLSNGPGDPEAVDGAPEHIRSLWYLSWPSVVDLGAWRNNVQASIWSSRCKPSSSQPTYGKCRDHKSEPQLLRRPKFVKRNCRHYAHQLERPHERRYGSA
jgi:carbamoyl-phosphate synthase small subunit